ncbi:hypothetical protein ACVOMV_32410 [Mesorhizobium atlanticum]
MIADARKARAARRNGLKGGNPSLSKERAFPPSDKRRARAGDKVGDKPQSPDSQSPQAIDPSGEKAHAFLPPLRGTGTEKRLQGNRQGPNGNGSGAGRMSMPPTQSSRRSMTAAGAAAGGEGAGRDVFLLPAIRAG